MRYPYENSALYYEVIGEGEQVLILHGFGGNMAYMKACMEPVFEAEKDYQRIYVDLPGMGKSRFELQYATSDDILNILISFIKDCIEGTFLLVGQSYGGYIARGILSHCSERVDGMMLLCPVVFPRVEDRNIPKTDIKYIDQDFLSQLNVQDRERYLEYAIIVNETTYERFHKAAHTAFEEADQDFIDRLKEHYACSFDIDERIRSLHYEKPVLFITARQDLCVGYVDQWDLVKDYPGADYSLVNMAGHNMQTEQPDIFCCLVNNWLLKIEK